MAAITYDVMLGALHASNHAQQGGPLLLSLTAELALEGEGEGGGSRCVVDLAAADVELPKLGDPASIKLESDGRTTVFTGWVHEVKVTEGTLAITAVDGPPSPAPPGSDGTHHTFVYRTEVIAIGLAQVRPRGRLVVQSWPQRGFVDVVGKPAVSPGDLVKIDGIPATHPSGLRAAGPPLRVRRVRHTLAPRQGFITRMEF